MVSEGRGLVASLNSVEAQVFWIVAGMRIHEAYVIVVSDELCKFGSQLPDKQQVWPLTELIQSTRFQVGASSPQVFGNSLQNVPGNPIIFSIRVAVPND
jgi:hypothetical protein